MFVVRLVPLMLNLNTSFNVLIALTNWLFLEILFYFLLFPVGKIAEKAVCRSVLAPNNKKCTPSDCFLTILPTGFFDDKDDANNNKDDPKFFLNMIIIQS